MSPVRTVSSGERGVILDPQDERAIESYLLDHGFIGDGEAVKEVGCAGPGNMNLVLRVLTTSQNLIVKQARPYVEKYPHIAAPPQRALVEAEWYALAGSRPELASRLPRLQGVDSANNVLVLGDLGPAADLTGLYAGERLDDESLGALVLWLAALHEAFLGDEAARELRNAEMRRLNHEHIFEVPLRAENGLDLDAVTPGLASLAVSLRADRRLRAALADLGSAYLGEGTTLLHGDYYPGSWLAVAGGPYIIDPEFGFFGPPEFDVGVAIAHLELAGQPEATGRRFLAAYEGRVELDAQLAWAFAGAEVVRRLLGVSQLPLSAGLEEKHDLIERAADRLRAVA